MKIRNGFVSNSSSSSFIAIGVKVKKLTEEQEKAIEAAGLEANYMECEGYIVGEEFACWDECDGACVSSIEELEETISKVKKALKGLDIGNNKIGVHYGIRVS